jgi:hypothetical protein
MQAETVVEEAGSSATPDLEVRCVGGLAGLYVLSSRERAKAKLQTFACRTQALTAHSITLSAPVMGSVGEPVAARFSKIGIVRGEILRRTFTGFEMSIDLTNAERAAFATKVKWLKTALSDGAQDMRGHLRFAPNDPHSTLVLSDGRVVPCFVIDISSSGASVSADCNPSLKTPLALGRMVGRVVRHFEGGFAIHFVDKQDMYDVDVLLSPAPAEIELD